MQTQVDQTKPSPIFLNLSICVRASGSLDEVQAELKDRLECLLDDIDLTVFSCKWDREQALAFVRASAPTPRPVESTDPSQSNAVAAVLARYNLTIPKTRLQDPPWRVPSGNCWGEIEGLPTMRGKLVLTNGIKAFIVREDGYWWDCHYDWFIPDRVETLPDGLEAPKGKKGKVGAKTIKCFDGI